VAIGKNPDIQGDRIWGECSPAVEVSDTLNIAESFCPLLVIFKPPVFGGVATATFIHSSFPLRFLTLEADFT
jgi:hypothetical protein